MPPEAAAATFPMTWASCPRCWRRPPNGPCDQHRQDYETFRDTRDRTAAQDRAQSRQGAAPARNSPR